MDTPGDEAPPPHLPPAAIPTAGAVHPVGGPAPRHQASRNACDGVVVSPLLMEAWRVEQMNGGESPNHFSDIK
ncbi:hypothetical protein EYF80_063891 [Liparis tanakae]|uniref:Uncharacterized protein n=1 Tax=Liparis tanakae TaxID=230148 RepID=A0A4Z2EB71_9TELE|nr:hypothetical protein EYF80_063891 [Liparis tanakae]